MGQIRNISAQTTNITYSLDDGTGSVEVKQWIDNDSNSDSMETADAPKPSKLVQNGYCRVWGRLKAFNNKRHVGAHVIRPITNMNEINYALLEATAVHLYFTKGPPNTSGGGEGGAAMANGGDTNGAGNTNGRALPPMTPLARRVYNLLKETPQSNEGLHVQDLASQLSAGVNDIYKASEELLSTGMIFTTVDDNTWAILEF